MNMNKSSELGASEGDDLPPGSSRGRVIDDGLPGQNRTYQTNIMTNLQNDNQKVSKTRYVVCTLGVISLTMSFMLRCAINLSITSMVDPRMLYQSNKTVSSDGSCPIPGAILLNDEEKIDYNVSKNQTFIYLDDRIDPDKVRIYPPQIVTQFLGEEPNEEKFMWTIEQQSHILGGFYYSYVFFMIIGGRLAEIYGAKYVLLVGVASSSLINLATPWMARNSLALLISSRVLMGALQSSVFPAMYALINRWLSEGEMSIFTPLMKLSLRLGQVLATLVPGLISNWPGAFYVIGGLGILWSILWLFLATSDPSANKWVSEAELAHIMKNKKRKTLRIKTGAALPASGRSSVNIASSKQASTPWLKILSSPSFIGLCLAKLSYNLCTYFLSLELPSYLKYVHHVSRPRISAISTSMATVQVCLTLPVGWLAKIMVEKRPWGLSKTSIRKIFQSVSTFGSGLLLLLLMFNSCSLTYVTIDLQVLAFVGIFVVGGDMMLPYDLSEEYPATIVAIANSFGNISAIIITTMTSLVLDEQGGSQARWNIVIGIMAGFVCLGGFLFCLLVKAEPIDLETKKKPICAEPLETLRVENHDHNRNPARIRKTSSQ